MPDLSRVGNFSARRCAEVLTPASPSSKKSVCRLCKGVYSSITSAQAVVHLSGIGKGIGHCSCMRTMKAKKVRRTSRLYMRRGRTRSKRLRRCVAVAGSSREGTISNYFSSAGSDEVSMAVAFFYENGVPFNAADTPSFLEMVQALRGAGKSWKPPSRKVLSTTLLAHAEKRVEEHIHAAGFDEAMKTFGMVLTSDGWENTNRQSLLGFCGVTTKGSRFLAAVNCEGQTKSSDFFVGEDYCYR